MFQKIGNVTELILTLVGTKKCSRSFALNQQYHEASTCELAFKEYKKYSMIVKEYSNNYLGTKRFYFVILR